MSATLNIYKNKKVLVTGHTGFKGSWLCIWLNKLGAEVVGYALDPYTKKDNFLLAKVSDKLVDVRGDIREINRLKDIFKKHKPEIVFHLAAQSLVRESYDNPKETYEVNIGGTVNVLENCRLNDSVKVIIIVTSDKCYENKGWVWGYRENDELGGYDPYSSSKACAELVINSYRNSYFNPYNYQQHGKTVASARAGNVIGGGDWREDRIIPDCIRSFERDRAIYLRNPSATRPWQYVLEPLGGYLILGKKMLEDPKRYGDSWNFGPESHSITSVKGLVEILINSYGKGSWLPLQRQSEKKESNFLSLDINKAQALLGWRPLLSVDQAIERTVDWYKNYSNYPDMQNFCDKQISSYMELWSCNENL
jgi:CDP-glucose 4,6-dehydratase